MKNCCRTHSYKLNQSKPKLTLDTKKAAWVDKDGNVVMTVKDVTKRLIQSMDIQMTHGLLANGIDVTKIEIPNTELTDKQKEDIFIHELAVLEASQPAKPKESGDNKPTPYTYWRMS